MPADDREQQFERGLARHLRGGSPDATCPDAEILAAYHERTLSPEELEQWKKHIAGCARCQESLALVESSEVAMKEEWQEQIVPASRWSAAEHLASATISAPKQPTSGGATQVVAMQDRSGKNVAEKKRKIFKWVAPAGAIAAGLVLWLGLRHSQQVSHYSATPAATQVAENRSQTEFSQNEPKTADEGQAWASTAKKIVPVPGDSTAVRKDALPQVAPPSPKLAPPSLQMRAPSPSVGRAAGAYAGMNGAMTRNKLDKLAQGERDEKELSQQMESRQKNEGIGGGYGNGIAAQSSPPAVSGKVAEQPAMAGGRAEGAASVSFGAGQPAATPAKPAPAPAKTQAMDKAKEEVPGEIKQSVETANAAPSADTSAAAQQSTVETRRESPINRRNHTNLMTLAPGVASNVIAAPNGKYAWRVGAAGLIERSSDTGKTWEAQNSGVTADLISGAAPTEKICWVAGKAGTLLLTTDGGKRWKIVKTPVGKDLERVQASDAQHAQIWIAGNRAAYETENGGLSWSPVGLD